MLYHLRDEPHNVIEAIRVDAPNHDAIVDLLARGNGKIVAVYGDNGAYDLTITVGSQYGVIVAQRGDMLTLTNLDLIGWFTYDAFLRLFDPVPDAPAPLPARGSDPTRPLTVGDVMERIVLPEPEAWSARPPTDDEAIAAMVFDDRPPCTCPADAAPDGYGPRRRHRVWCDCVSLPERQAAQP